MITYHGSIVQFVEGVISRHYKFISGDSDFLYEVWNDLNYKISFMLCTSKHIVHDN